MFLTFQLPMVGYWPTKAVTGNRELGFESGAVIPAPTSYIKVVAVKKDCSLFSVEDNRSALAGEHLDGPGHLLPKTASALHRVERYSEPLRVEEIKLFQACAW